ncbi:MAG: hypothetical protein IPM74_03465 [Crocinitomicaceae bacterium]|nr:hypothetical protein [Crocinitomicaceae bacterium]MBK8924972.1 hypothetical protein [Crocinitomicaceae bacterium]
MKQIYIVISLCWFISCSPSNDPKNNQDKDVIHAEDTIYEQAVKEVQYFSSDSADVLKAEKNDTTIDFSWVPTESHLFNLTLDNKKVCIQSNLVDIKTISYCLETSITIQAEGSHYDMINWKHGATEWQRLIYEGTCDLPADTISNCTSFAFNVHPDDDANLELPFPDTPMSEVRSEVKKLYGSVWSDHIRHVKKVGEYPCSIGISNYIFKIRYQHQDSKKNETTYLRVPVAMGC